MPHEDSRPRAAHRRGKKFKRTRSASSGSTRSSPSSSSSSDEELRERYRRAARARAEAGEDLDELLYECFALVREAGKRTMGMRHFDVQLIGGMVLHGGSIAEMRTGEGKTLTATLAVVLNSLAGKGVHVVTVNDYLARRDAEWMTPIYDVLGVTVGVLQNMQPYEEKQRRLRRRRHLRHQLRVRLRLPARQHGAVAGGEGPARRPLRRGRQAARDARTSRSSTRSTTSSSTRRARR